ncbi:MAG: hypothetical protein ACN6PM_24640 [Achromobacter mucicolens]|uniref:hypothetical protein n=1 Tax=Achromobacter mucicolens TaxID=1389922 RepID=UPI003D114D0C
MSPQALLEHLAFDEIDGDWAFRLPVESCDLWNRAIFGIERRYLLVWPAQRQSLSHRLD